MNIFLNNELSEHAMMVLKNQSRSFNLLLKNYLLILKILPITRFKDSKMAFF
jgi:hypothetical protein